MRRKTWACNKKIVFHHTILDPILRRASRKRHVRAGAPLGRVDMPPAPKAQWVLGKNGIWYLQSNSPVPDADQAATSAQHLPSTPPSLPSASMLDALTATDLTNGDSALFRMDADFDVLTSTWVASQPLLEIAPPPSERFLTRKGQSRHVVRVQASWKVESETLAALRPHTLLRVLETRELTDGSKRAMIALHRAKRPLGWLVMTTADGEPILQIFARPIYEVTRAAVKVRREFDLGSKYVGQLRMGTRLHVVDTRRASRGDTRVAVRVLGEMVITGWITSTRSEGARMLLEVSQETDTVEMLGEQICPANVRSKRPGSSPRTPRPELRTSLSPAPVLVPRESTSPSQQQQEQHVGSKVSGALASAREKKTEGHMGEYSARGRPRSSPKSPWAVKSPWSSGLSCSGSGLGERRSERPASSSVTTRVMASGASSISISSRFSSRGRGSPAGGGRVTLTTKSSAVPTTRVVPQATVLDADLSAAAREHWQRAFRLVCTTSVSSYRTMQVIEKKLDSFFDRWRRDLCASAVIEVEVKELRTKIEAHALKVDKMATSRFVEALLTRHGPKKVLDAIAIQWPPDPETLIVRDRVLRSEFAAFVRSYIDASNTSINEIYETFDRGPHVEMTKLKASLGRLVQESTSERAFLQTLQTKGADLKDKETIYLAAFHATLRFEEAAEQVEKVKRDTTVGARLGQIMVRKGMTAKDLVETWDTSGRGEISKDDFRAHCLALGVVAPTADINELFCSLDADGGGSLDKYELRAALKQLEDEAYKARNARFDLQKHTMDLAEVMRATQAAWMSLKKREALLEEIAEADARLRRAAEKNAAAEAEKSGRNEVVQGAAADSGARRRRESVDEAPRATTARAPVAAPTTDSGTPAAAA